MILQHKIVHVITSLDVGGAEKMLLNLIENKKYRNKYEICVVSLKGTGELEKRLRQLGIKVINLNITFNGISAIIGGIKLWKLFMDYKPDVIQTWLYHADLLGGFTGKIYNACPIVWGIHNAFLDPKAKKTTKFIVWICKYLSYIIPDKIISCSNFAANVHKKFGYKNIFKYIPNGFDVNKFKPDSFKRATNRIKLNLDENVKVFGIIARYDPIKDHKTFLLAAKELKDKNLNVKFLLCGNGIDWKNKVLLQIIQENNLQDDVILLGYQEIIYDIILSLDFLVLSSKSEAFPMVLGESMAAGISCISTNVGDAALIIGKTGIIVEPENTNQLAKAMLDAYYMPDEKIRKMYLEARQHILENFSIEKVVEEYISLYDQLILNKY